MSMQSVEKIRTLFPQILLVQKVFFFFNGTLPRSGIQFVNVNFDSKTGIFDRCRLFICKRLIRDIANLANRVWIFSPLLFCRGVEGERERAFAEARNRGTGTTNE